MSSDMILKIIAALAGVTAVAIVSCLEPTEKDDVLRLCEIAKKNGDTSDQY